MDSCSIYLLFSFASKGVQRVWKKLSFTTYSVYLIILGSPASRVPRLSDRETKDCSLASGRKFETFPLAKMSWLKQRRPVSWKARAV